MNDTPAHLVREPLCRRVHAIAVVTGGALALAVTAPGAGARTATLHLFSRQASNPFVTPHGKPLPANHTSGRR
jgi:hypothetical protein